MRSAQAMASAFRTPEMYWDHEYLFAGLAISVRPFDRELSPRGAGFGERSCGCSRVSGTEAR